MSAQAETGRILTDARTAAGRSIEEMAVATRINARFLSEIEAGTSFSLPAIYRRTFVRTYARALGVDPETLPADPPPAPEAPPAGASRPETAAILAEGPPVEKVVTSGPGANPFADSSQLRTMIIVVALLVTALYFSVRWFASGPDEPPPGPVPTAATAAPETSAAARPERLPAFSAGDGTRGAAAAGQGDSLVFHATTTESVWVHIVIDNDSTIEYTLPPRYSITLRARDNFLLAVGNPAGLTFSLNGRKMDVLGTGSKPVKNVFLSRKSLTE